ncbi:MAG TPA: hypothetical protein VKQ52_03535, partial [Puia sp.]|nr:hypothetical protein [Puia sp.]
MNQGRIGWVVYLAGTFFFVTVWTGCHSYTRNVSHKNVPLESIRKGEALAGVYCQSCHLLPEPSLLDSRSWEKGVLPAMGPRLGIFHHDLEMYPSSRKDTNLDKSFYPSAPLMSDEEWQHILDYYTATSPDSLPGQERQRPIRRGLSLFRAEAPPLGRPTPATSLVKMDTGLGGHELWVFDVHYKSLYLYDSRLEQVDSVPDKGAIVDIVRQGAGLER